MKLLRNLDEFPDQLRNGAVSIGNFDGVHRGHARIMQQLLDSARAVGGPAVVFTFDPHPVRLLRPELAPPPLTWTRRKADLLAELGVDAVVAYPTDRDLLELSPTEFFQRVVVEQLEALAMVEGPNFFFGKDRAGDVDQLGQLCDQADIQLEVVEPLQEGDGFISSSRVRQLIAGGDVAEAGQLLTRPYRIRGMVTHGAGRGKSIGFPTANVAAIDTLLPAHGVYAGRAYTAQGAATAAINLGPNPTFGDQSVKVEVHLIGTDESLYGLPLEVDFLSRMRDILPFDSVDQLRDQLARDVNRASSIVAQAESQR
jgi:riboflavin kinase/FMN adenylyltransferase